MSEPQRVLYHVQVLRLIAAFSILISHAAKMFGIHARLFWYVPWSAGVDVFFVISGFIMTYLTQDQFGAPGAARGFLTRRAVRIIPPYWFFTLLIVAVYPIVSWQMRDKTIDPAWLTASLGFVPWPRPDGKLNPVLAQGWTLNYEAFFYVVFGLALLWRRGIWLVLLGLVGLVACNRVIPDSWYLLKFWSDPIILCFVGGIGLACLHRRGVRVGRLVRIASVVAAALVFVLLRQHHGILIAAFIVAAGFILSEQPDRLGPVQRLLQYGGDASYTIYLSHTIVIGLIAAWWVGAVPGLLWLGVGLSTIASLAFALGFYRWAEVPVTRWLRRKLV